MLLASMNMPFRGRSVQSPFSKHSGGRVKACRPSANVVFRSILMLVLASAPSAHAQSPLAVPVDGEPFHAGLTSIDAQEKLVLDEAGKRRTIAAGDLVSWGQPAELRKGPVVVLADGGFLPAVVLGDDMIDLSIESDLLGTLKLPLDSLAGIVFRMPPHPAELDALLDRLAKGQARSTGNVGSEGQSQPDGQAQTDRLILDNGDEVTGLIETLKSDKVAIKGKFGPVEVAVRRVVALVFNPALRRRPAAQAQACWVGLGDGARLLATRMNLEGDSLDWTTLSGAKLKAAAADLVFFMPRPAGGRPSRVVYLSDIRPDAYRFLPYLETNWPYTLDRNVTGGQLRSGGRLYLKGLGVHSAARLSYLLDRPWSRFQAEVGIDDSTDGRGSVGFRVFVDGAQKYASPPIRGRMPPQAISIELVGAKRLDLVVDYGEAADVMDHADWLNARLVK